MEILEYDDLDPMSVFRFNMLALDLPLTPEYVAHLRRTDPRPLACFALYAVEKDRVLAQAGLLRFPMMSVEGHEDVGAVWALAAHPQFAGPGVASRLLEEAHARLRVAGLRFSMPVTDRYRPACSLYLSHGYEDVQVLATALARWETAHQPTRLEARRAGPDGAGRVEKACREIAGKYLGFARQFGPIAPLRERAGAGEAWLLWENRRLAGCALTRLDKTMLHIGSLLLDEGIDAAEAVAAVVSELRTPYVKVKISRPSEIAGLQRLGFQIIRNPREACLVRPLVPEVDVGTARRLFGIGTDRFLISWPDVG